MIETEVHPTARRMLGLVVTLLRPPLVARETLSVAWSHWPPFSQIAADGTLGGLDVTLTRQILGRQAEPAFRKPTLGPGPLPMERQQLDVAMGALKTPRQGRFARFSALSARQLRAAEPAPAGRGARRLAKGSPRWQPSARPRASTWRSCGVPAPADERGCPALGQAVGYNSDDRLLTLLLARRLGGVIMEWQYARYQLRASNAIQCQVLLHQQPVRLMFAKKAVNDEALARIDAAIATLPSPDPPLRRPAAAWTQPGTHRSRRHRPLTPTPAKP